MKKRILAIILLLSMMAVPASAEIDPASMTDEELRATIAACAAELTKRNTTEKGVLLFDQAGVSLYQTGEPYISKSGRLEIPITAYNDLDVVASIDPVFVSCNGITVMGYGLTNISPQSAYSGELDFATKDLQLNSIQDVYSLVFQWQIYSPGNGVVLLTEERYEYAF